MMRIESVRVHGDHDESYVIDIEDGHGTCTCLAFAFHPEKPCKHMRFVLDVLTGVTA